MAKARSKKPRTVWSESAVAGLLRVPAGPVDLNTYDPRSTPGFAGDKRAGRRQLAAMAAPLSDLQERLFANGRTGAKRRLLLVVQGMDTSGKGGVMRHAVGLMDPQGLRVKAFKAPTPEEKRRGFLWRVRQALPAAGEVGRVRSQPLRGRAGRTGAAAHNRCHDRASVRRHQRLRGQAGRVRLRCRSKSCCTSPAREQKARLMARLDDPTKHWKYNPRRRRRAAALGRLPAVPTRSPSSDATPTTRHGTSCRQTGSGTATGRSPGCWSSTLTGDGAGLAAGRLRRRARTQAPGCHMTSGHAVRGATKRV